MGFGDIFKNTGLPGISSGLGSLKPGSPEFKRMMGLAVADNERIAAADDDDEIILVSMAEFKRKTGTDFRKVLESFENAAPAPSATAPSTTAPAATAPAATAPAAGSVVVINPLLDLDLVPVRPGDLITAASYNALIAACASLHVRLSLLEARAGMQTPATTPTPTPGTTPTPPATRLPPDLKTAYVVNNRRSTQQLTTIFATGLRLNSMTDARLVYQDQVGKNLGSTSLPKRRASPTSAIFSVGPTPKKMLDAATVLLEISGPDGKDRLEVERPTAAVREQFELLLTKVDDPLDLIDDLDGKVLRSTGGPFSDLVGNLR